MEKGKLFYITRNYDYDSSPQNSSYAGITKDAWISMIHALVDTVHKSDLVDYMAYIFHDNDIDEDGLPKPLHAHIFVRFKATMTQDKVIEIFGTSSEQNTQRIRSAHRMSKYMIHISDDALDKEKTIYSKDAVYCINCKYEDMLKKKFWGSSKNNDENALLKVDNKQAQAIADDLGLKIRNGEIRHDKALKQLEKQAGYGWVRKLGKSFDDDREQFIKNKVEDMTLHGRNNRNIYIMGSGGIGKTTIARLLGSRKADGKGLYQSAPLGLGKTPDALNGYTDETVAVLNEMTANGWTIDEFLQCFDPYSYSAFPSRNANKDFIGHTSIFTNSISPLRFAKDLVIYSKGGSIYQDPSDKHNIDYENPDAMDKYWQVRRRFNNMIVLLQDENNKDLVNAFVFNIKGTTSETGNHVLIGNISFTLEHGKKPIVSENALDDLEKLLDIDANNITKDVKTLDDFLDENGLIEISKDDVIDSFVDEVVSKCEWDLLPTRFLYSLYLVYRQRYFATSVQLNIKEFVNKLKNHLTDFAYTENAIRHGSMMDADEPLISEYGLDQPDKNGAPSEWMAVHYKAKDPVKRRDFPRKLKYRGFVRR